MECCISNANRIRRGYIHQQRAHKNGCDGDEWGVDLLPLQAASRLLPPLQMSVALFEGKAKLSQVLKGLLCSFVGEWLPIKAPRLAPPNSRRWVVEWTRGPLLRLQHMSLTWPQLATCACSICHSLGLNYSMASSIFMGAHSNPAWSVRSSLDGAI